VAEADISRGFERLATAIKAAQQQLATQAAVAALATALPALAVETAAVQAAAATAAAAISAVKEGEGAESNSGVDASAVKEMQEAGELPGAGPETAAAAAVVPA
jgi:hypothetical protein